MIKETDLKFTKEHEWVTISQDNVATVGISRFAQESLGDIVFVELPKIGEKINKNQIVGSVESVKTVSDIFSPLSGTVVETNLNLSSKPELVNESPYERGWMFKLNIENTNEIDLLLSFEDYKKTHSSS